MRILLFPSAVVIVASLLGCQRQSAAPQPFLVKSNSVIEHAFYRDITLDEFLKMLPSGAIDSVNLNFEQGPQVFAWVKVADMADRDLSKVRFETTFKTEDGRVIVERWTAAKDRKSGPAAAVFCLPSNVVDAQTKEHREN